MRQIIYLIVLGSLLCCSGCRTSSDFNYIEDSIRGQIYPAKLENDIKFSVGSLSMKMINCFVDDKEDKDMFLKEIKSVQIGVYKIHNADNKGQFRIPGNVEKTLIDKGWEPFVRVRKKNEENVLILYRQMSEKIMSMYVISLEQNELVIVEVNGNLNNIMEKAICEHRLAGVNHI
jgi:hypothetical protein